MANLNNIYPQHVPTLGFTNWFIEYEDQIGELLVSHVANNPEKDIDIHTFHDKLYRDYIQHQLEYPDMQSMIKKGEEGKVGVCTRAADKTWQISFFDKNDLVVLFRQIGNELASMGLSEADMIIYQRTIDKGVKVIEKKK